MPMSSKFPAESTGEKTVKIGQYLAKIWTKYDSLGLLFFGPPCILRTDRPTGDRRPTNDLTFGKISNGHISSRGCPIHFMFGSIVGFSRSADRIALFPVRQNPRWRLGGHLGKFKWRYLRGGSSDLLRVWS